MAKANKKYGGKYDYSSVEFTGRKNQITVVCPVHGAFKLTPEGHLTHGQECKKCKKASVSESFFAKANKVHNSFYDYSASIYVDSHTKIKIICPEHGEFWQAPNNHLAGKGCGVCRYLKVRDKLKSSYFEFKEKANRVHGGKYHYPKFEYVNANSKIPIVCHEHGEFWQTPGHHLSGQGCYKCSCSGTSLLEGEIKEYLESITEVEANNRIILDGKEIDILIPETKVGIEVNGTYWHSEAQGKERNYHLNKKQLANKKGVRLIFVWEHLYAEKKELVFRMLGRLAGVGTEKIMGRKCKIEELGRNEARDFLNRHHLMPPILGQLCLGLRYEGRLVAVATYGKRAVGKLEEDSIELLRFCIPPEVSVHGALNKLTKKALRLTGEGKCLSYVDLDWFDGASFEASGWSLEGATPPGYWWIKGKNCIPRWKAQKHKLGNLLGENFNPIETEVENMRRCGWARVWNCGNLKYSYILKSRS